jgi:hypothetical protein
MVDKQFVRFVDNLNKSYTKFNTNKLTERFVEDLFMKIFNVDKCFKASRDESPTIKLKNILFTDGIVAFENRVFNIFELKKTKSRFIDADGNLMLNKDTKSAISQAMKYILSSNDKLFDSEYSFSSVLLFNGYEIVRVYVSDIKETFLKTNWDKEIADFIQQNQLSLNQFLESFIEKNFDTLYELFRYEIIFSFQETKIEKENCTRLFEILKSQNDEKINIIRINLKQKFQQFSNLFNTEKIALKTDSMYDSLVYRIFIEISPHLADGVQCTLRSNKKDIRFTSNNEEIQILHSIEADDGSIEDVSILIDPSFVIDINEMNRFFDNHTLQNIDILYEDYDNLITDKRTKKSIGLFFTKSDLAYFSSEFLKFIISSEQLRKCHIYDPAAGSGNLLKAQETYTTIIGSDIKRANYDIMKNRNITVSKAPIDFLITSRKDIIEDLNSLVNGNSYNFIDNPLMILMNPPYRGKNTWVDENGIGNKEGVSSEMIQSDAAFSRIVKDYGLKSIELSSFFMIKALSFFMGSKYNGYIAVFSPTNWLSSRSEHESFKKFFLKNVEFIGGFIVTGSDFFDNLKGKFPIAFSIFKVNDSKTSSSLEYLDLTKQSSFIKKLYQNKRYKEKTSFIENELDTERHTNYQSLWNSLINSRKVKYETQEKPAFQNIFRSINSQTGDDENTLMQISENFKTIDFSKEIDKDIANDRIFVVAVDKKINMT